jgi:hypothetical protein
MGVYHGRALLVLGAVLLLGASAGDVEAGGSFGPSPAHKRPAHKRTAARKKATHKRTAHRKKATHKRRTAHKRRTVKRVAHKQRHTDRYVQRTTAARDVQRVSAGTTAGGTRAAAAGAARPANGAAAASAAAAAGKGNLYVLSVEVDSGLVAKGAKDPDAVEATQLARVLRNKAAYRHVYTRVLLGKRASRRGILRGFSWLKRSMTPRDVAVIFISSHGGMDPLGFFGLFPAHYNADKKAETAVWAQEMREELLQTAGLKLVLVESCNSAAFLRSPAQLRPLPNTHIICSARLLESSGTGLGYALPKGLSGAAANRDGVVTSDQLERYLRRQVVKVSGGKQHIAVSRPKGMPNLVLTRK